MGNSNNTKYVGGLLLTLLITFSGIIFNGMNNDIKDNKISINRLVTEKMDKNEIVNRLDRIEGYLMVVSTKSAENDIYIESVSENLKELKKMFKDYVLDK